MENVEIKNKVGILSIGYIKLNDEYCKKFNIINDNGNKYFHLLVDGVIKNNNIYTTSTISSNTIGKDKDYYLIFKCIEASYPDSVTKDYKKKKHLAYHYCIIDSQGNEKKVFDDGLFNTPIQYKNSRIYSFDGNVFDCETNFCYGYSTETPLLSDENIFINVNNDIWSYKKKSNLEKGIYRISLKTGEYEFFK